MSSQGKVHIQFKLGVDDWEIFTERLEFYFDALDFDDDKKRSLLLTKVDIETYNLIWNLVAPKKLKDLSNDEVIEKLSDHLALT